MLGGCASRLPEGGKPSGGGAFFGMSFTLVDMFSEPQMVTCMHTVDIKEDLEKWC